VLLLEAEDAHHLNTLTSEGKNLKSDEIISNTARFGPSGSLNPIFQHTQNAN